MLFKVQDKISFVQVSVYITTLFECIPIVTMSYPELVEFWLVWYYEKINLKVKAWMKTFFFVIASGGNVEQPLNFRGFTATSSIFRFFPSCILSTKTKQKINQYFLMELKKERWSSFWELYTLEVESEKDEFFVFVAWQSIDALFSVLLFWCWPQRRFLQKD